MVAFFCPPPFIKTSGGVAAPGQQLFTGDDTFVVPAGVTSISAVCVGAGGTRSSGSGRGGDLRWASSIAVTPGESLTISVPVSGASTSAAILRSGTPLLQAASGAGGTSSTIGGAIGGGSGGTRGSNTSNRAGAGGAGGYSGDGGNSGDASGTDGSSGTGGAGGGGGGTQISGRHGGGGGGVGLLGEGSSGAGGVGGTAAQGGGGGSGGGGGGPFSGGSGGGAGGLYGGGTNSASDNAGQGAVRIIWGTGRAYPSTDTGDV